MTIKSARYSHESMDINISSKMPSSLMVYLSMSWSTVGVSLMPVSHKAFIVLHVIMFMVAPRSINLLVMSVLLICILTTRLLGSKYLVVRTSPIINSDSFPMTWMVWGFSCFLLGFLKQSLCTSFE